MNQLNRADPGDLYVLFGLLQLALLRVYNTRCIRTAVGWIDLSIRTYWENREKKKRKERKKKEITERDDS